MLVFRVFNFLKMAVKYLNSMKTQIRNCDFENTEAEFIGCDEDFAHCTLWPQISVTLGTKSSQKFSHTCTLLAHLSLGFYLFSVPNLQENFSHSHTFCTLGFRISFTSCPISGKFLKINLSEKYTNIKVQWNIVIKNLDITKPSHNEVILLVPALYICLFFTLI